MQFLLEDNLARAVTAQSLEEPGHFQLFEGQIPEQVTLKVLSDGAILTKVVEISSNLFSSNVAACHCVGRRAKMEDTVAYMKGSFCIEDKLYPVEIFSLFDGHGGDKVSLFLQEKCSSYVQDALSEMHRFDDKEVINAFDIAFKRLNASLEDAPFVGSTATVVCNMEGSLWVANVGDSRAAVYRDDFGIIRLTEDANIDNQRFKEEIEKKGGLIRDGYLRQYCEDSRVAMLAVARAVGNHLFVCNDGKPLISAEPVVTKVSLPPKGSILLLSCDGLFEKASTIEIGGAIEKMKKQEMDLKEMAERLVYSVLARPLKHASFDNVTVFLVRL